MSSEETYYTILGIPEDVTDKQIKEAYLYKVNILQQTACRECQNEYALRQRKI
jgi:hypothetical protein